MATNQSKADKFTLVDWNNYVTTTNLTKDQLLSLLIEKEESGDYDIDNFEIIDQLTGIKYNAEVETNIKLVKQK